ncbi:gap junction delta-2 protein-like [Ambystoma mexicanum]|uniref:gap junction delta-2 protein-like n=1 Tax=Ambystoma mexicanum TaxID=8296 RepID=UPI0037E78D6D
MGDWSILGRLLTEVQNHSTVIGKIWLTMLLIFRILLVTLVGDAVYGDEQSKFTCNTLQPGCNNVCYDSFAPVSHLRFWIFQIVLVSTPSIFYIVYVLHKIAKDERMDLERAYVLELLQTLATSEQQQETGSLSQEPEDHLNSKLSSQSGERLKQRLITETTKNPIHLTDKVLIIYIVHVVLRSFMEIGFLVGQYYLFGFEVSPLFRCETYPCPTKTDCFISRATEKTIFLNFMFGVGLGCFVMNLAELHYLGWVYVFRILLAACSSCCDFKQKERKNMALYPQQNTLLAQLKDSIQEKLVLKNSCSPSQEKIGYMPTHPAAISFTNDSSDPPPKKSPDVKSKHGNVPKLAKSKKSWI